MKVGTRWTDITAKLVSANLLQASTTVGIQLLDASASPTEEQAKEAYILADGEYLNYTPPGDPLKTWARALGVGESELRTGVA